MSSGLDGPPHRGRCPLKVQRTRALCRRDGVSPAGMLMHPWVGRGQTATLYERFSEGEPGGFLGRSSGPQRGPTAPRLPPCGATRSAPLAYGPGGRSRRNTTPICTLRTPRGPRRELWISCASRRTSPCRPKAGHRGPHGGNSADTGTLYQGFGAKVPGPTRMGCPLLLAGPLDEAGEPVGPSWSPPGGSAL